MILTLRYSQNRRPPYLFFRGGPSLCEKWECFSVSLTKGLCFESEKKVGSSKSSLWCVLWCVMGGVFVCMYSSGVLI